MRESQRQKLYRRALQPQPAPSVGLASLVTPIVRSLLETQRALDDEAAQSCERFSEDGIPPTGYAMTSLRFSAGIAVRLGDDGISVAPRWDSDSQTKIAIRFVPTSLPELLSEEE